MLKNIVSNILFVILLQGIAFNAQAHVALDYPAGGETFTEGEFVIIQWHIAIPHVTLNWDLFFSTDGGQTWEIIQMNIPVGQLSYQWSVPNLATSEARVSVIMDNDGLDYQDESMNFTIQLAPSLPFIEIQPSDATFECNSNQQANIQAWLDSNGGAVAYGFCGDLEWENSYDGITDDCGATGTTLVFFTATDDCGSTSAAASLTITDTQSPTLTSPALNVTVECNGNGNMVQRIQWLANKGGATATDACSNVTWTNNYSTISNDCAATGSALVTFTATDDCGNSIATSATFAIEDNIAPSLITTAQNVTVECSENNPQTIQNWLTSHGGAIVSDVCGNVTWSNNYSGLNDECGASGSAEVIFTAIDDCGNSIATTATFRISDSTAPNIVTSAQNITLDCGSPNFQTDLQNWIDNQGGAIANDICGTVSWTHNYTGIVDTCIVITSVPVTFTASDECGNSNTTNAILTLLATTGVSNQEINDFDLKIFPNPALDHLNVYLDKNASLPGHLNLINTWGVSIFSIHVNTNEFQIPVNGFASGVYFLQMQTSDGIYTRKVIID